MTHADQFFLGLMSGTSMDGIDVAVVRLGDHKCDVVAAACVEYPDSIRNSLRSVRQGTGSSTIDMLGQLDRKIGECFADAAVATLSQYRIEPARIVAIGSHGQTLRHQPEATPPYTMQIGDPSIIAARTGITVVTDFRRGDMAVGGQGAPLTPAFHEWLFRHDSRNRVILNIGGIANITVLPSHGPVTGFDTGPGNTLLDAWARRHLNRNFDLDGSWAAEGLASENLLDALIQDPYFGKPPPKSTGFEYFNLEWLEKVIARKKTDLAKQDVQATLAELTVRSIADAIAANASGTSEVFVCGGGYHNRDLMLRLGRRLSDVSIKPTSANGLDPDWVEAAAFAWLAKRRMAGEPGNLPSVTGAERRVLLGGIFVS